jgi:hypothetical protein
VAEFLFRQKTNSNGSPFLLSAFVLSLALALSCRQSANVNRGYITQGLENEARLSGSCCNSYHQ